MKNKTTLDGITVRRNILRQGLTLIELLVVLVILIGIGGLLIPTISNALGRTHVSTCAQSFPEVHQMIQRAIIEGGSIGDNFDSGIYEDGSAVNNSALTFTNFEEGGANGTGTLATAALTAGEAASLTNAGITTVVDHADAATDPTFEIDGVDRAIADGETLITLTLAQAEGIFLPATDDGAGGIEEKYVWLGIGRSWSQLSSLAPEPPTHFGDTPGAFPDQVHSRFGVIMEVFDDVDASAEFRRVSYCLNGSDFETGDAHIGIYWNEIAEN